MATKSQRPKGPDGVLALNLAINALSVAKEISSVTPAPAGAVFSSVSILLTMIRVSFLLSCDEIPQAHK